MLELRWVSSMNWYGRSIHVQFSNDAASPERILAPDELRAERTFLRTFSEPQKTHENVLLGVFVRQEGLPPAIGGIISSKELN